MSRKEEIVHAKESAIRSTPIPELSAYSFLKGFQLGAEWADSTMIDKACNYFRNQEYSDVFIEDFCKAMNG